MIFKCDCCEITADMVDGEEAFREGWDAPPHFTGYVTCDLCPASTQFMPGGWAGHAPIHEQWEQNGRPEEYSQETCVLPELRVPQEKLDGLKAAIDGAGDDPIERVKAAVAYFQENQ